MRSCSSCLLEQPRSNFSNNQWAKGVGVSRCTDCVERSRPATTFRTARENNAFEAEYSRVPFAEGAFRYVAEGTYTRGERQGERCVVKWFKSGCVYDESFFANDIQVVDKAMEIIGQWNNARFINKRIILNRFQVWTDSRGRKTLVEPFIDNWEKFNSNSGWVSEDETSWNRVLQALSHYSYHITGGHFVLCDLQGGLYRNGVILTDPVILSRTRQFGVTDLGAQGISSFFAKHECNEYCRNGWTQPRNPISYFDDIPGTTMIADVSTMNSRAPLTQRDRHYYHYY
uniref:Alpha-type protein kinase domain-containing protein n=1 Tax=Timspurckia oligopyrenoides TaxID=708627 RepID=A0A7S0ZGD2_9RHOD|mmetsp:Transcript_4174/g.7329  ORF Transcript_4174/g.7329 Transcript_4174/m.7329 type:complete len:286 (+) Transcript_4174:93-950(+)